MQEPLPGSADVSDNTESRFKLAPRRSRYDCGFRIRYIEVVKVGNGPCVDRVDREIKRGAVGGNVADFNRDRLTALVLCRGRAGPCKVAGSAQCGPGGQ